jgi:hypothetical protein
MHVASQSGGFTICTIVEENNNYHTRLVRVEVNGL